MMYRYENLRHMMHSQLYNEHIFSNDDLIQEKENKIISFYKKKQKLSTSKILFRTRFNTCGRIMN